jgi:hypothetical protein
MTNEIEPVTQDRPFRIQTAAGYRKYLCSGLYLPSVTTVLSATETAKSKASLANWQVRNPGALQEASTRGSAIHLGCENYLRGIPHGVPDDYMDFWNGMSPYLDWFDELYWSERPLRSDWNHLRSDDREVAYVWSTEHKYAGCPDLVGTIGGVNVIADFKTSNGPYCSVFPQRGDAQGFGGFRKYQKCSQQLAAYRLALHERTGFMADVALIIVSTPETSQAIFIDGDQLALAESRFLTRCEQFHNIEGNDIEASEDCS